MIARVLPIFSVGGACRARESGCREMVADHQGVGDQSAVNGNRRAIEL
jgi:hypothetical protein